MVFTVLKQHTAVSYLGISPHQNQEAVTKGPGTLYTLRKSPPSYPCPPIRPHLFTAHSAPNSSLDDALINFIFSGTSPNQIGTIPSACESLRRYFLSKHDSIQNDSGYLYIYTARLKIQADHANV